MAALIKAGRLSPQQSALGLTGTPAPSKGHFTQGHVWGLQDGSSVFLPRKHVVLVWLSGMGHPQQEPILLHWEREARVLDFKSIAMHQYLPQKITQKGLP